MKRELTPVRIAVAVGAVALAFVLLRLVVAADGDISRFVVAGDVFTDPARVQPPIHVIADSAGYDGQFYWRLATSPTELHLEPHNGVQLDTEFRASRIGYPAIGWVLSLGQASLVKWSLVLTNVLAMAAVAFAGAALARSRGRQAVVGVALASSSGLIMSLSRDLCEVTMIAALVAGVALMVQRRPMWAAASWSLACLIHEQALFCILPFAAYRVVDKVRRREWSPVATDIAWLAPLAAFGCWQLACRAILGKVPVLTSGNNSLDVPFKGLFEQVRYWARNGIGPVEAIVLPQLALLIVLVVIAFRSSRSLQPEDQWLRWSLIGAAAVAVSLSNLIWEGPAELRQIVVLSTVAWLVIIVSGRRIPVSLVAATGTVWILTAAVRIVEI